MEKSACFVLPTPLRTLAVALGLRRRARLQTSHALAVSDARIQQRVKQVYDQIGRDYEEAGEEHGTHDHGYVLVLDRLPGLDADAGPPEDLLDHQQPTQSEAQVHAEHGDHRPHRVAEGVLEDHSAVLKALGPRRADVVLAQHLEHPRPRHAGVEGRLGYPEGESGQHQAHEAARAPEGEDRDLVGEDVEQNDPQPELWKGQAYENKDVGKTLHDSPLDRDDDTRSDADGQLDQDSEYGQCRGVREALHDRRENLLLGPVRPPKVP